MRVVDTQIHSRFLPVIPFFTIDFTLALHTIWRSPLSHHTSTPLTLDTFTSKHSLWNIHSVLEHSFGGKSYTHIRVLCRSILSCWRDSVKSLDTCSHARSSWGTGSKAAE